MNFYCDSNSSSNLALSKETISSGVKSSSGSSSTDSTTESVTSRDHFNRVLSSRDDSSCLTTGNCVNQTKLDKFKERLQASSVRRSVPT